MASLLKKKTARILSIDGGGIRGLIPATILKNWEDKIGPISQHFHMLSGTSTGGIIACGLANNIKAIDLVSLYADNGASIFNSQWTALGGLASQLYDASGLEKVVAKALLGNLSSVSKDLLVTTYDIENRIPFLFKSWKARGVELSENELAGNYDFKLQDVARATSAAPTYFTPAQIVNSSGTKYAMIDGGVYANDPAMCAYIAAKRIYPLADEYLIVSLGTGATVKPIKYEDAVSFGIAGWAKPLLDIMFDGVTSTTEYELSQILNVTQYRFQTSLKNGSEAMDDVSSQNLSNLIKDANLTGITYSSQMDSMIERLKEPLIDVTKLGYPKVTTKVSAGMQVVSQANVKTVVNPTNASAAMVGGISGGFLGGPIGAAIGAGLGYLFGNTDVAQKVKV